MALVPSYNSSANTKLQATGVWSPPPVSAVATIAVGQTTSDAVETQGKLGGLIVPDGMVAADITFLGGMTEATCTSPIYDNGVIRTIPAAQVVAGRALTLDLLDWLPWPFVKLVLSAAPAAERKFTMSLVL